MLGFAREDLTLVKGPRKVNPEEIDFVIITTNLNIDQDTEKHFPKMKLIHSVDRAGVPLANVYAFIE